jgi:hypothetical protein
METISKTWELEKSKQVNVIVLLWRWWSARNNVNNGGRVWCAAEIYGSITFFLLEFKKLEVNGKKVQSLPFNLGSSHVRISTRSTRMTHMIRTPESEDGGLW